MYCDRLHGDWHDSCPSAPDKLHWTALEKVQALEIAQRSRWTELRVANRLLLAGAVAKRALEIRGRRAQRKARQAVPSRPDSLEMETEAAKISDTIAVCTGDQSLPVGSTFDQLEGRS